MPETFEMSRLQGIDPEIQALLNDCSDIEPQRFRDGEFLMREQEESRYLFIVLEGAYVVERPAEVPGAPATILATVEAGPGNPSVVGEMAYFGAQRRNASVRSVGSTWTLCLQPHHIDRIVEGSPGLLKIIFRQYAQRFSDANRTMRDLQARFAMDPERRMASAGECLFRAGETADRVYQIVIGVIQLEGPDGIQTVGPDDLPNGFLGLAPYLRGLRHSCTATVVENAFLMAVGISHREALVRSFPGLVLDQLAAEGVCKFSGSRADRAGHGRQGR
jgi:CRP-like cAMP-binding protein